MTFLNYNKFIRFNNVCTKLIIFCISLQIFIFTYSSSANVVRNGNCIPKCLISLDVDVKCGSNGITYQNIEELNCAIQFCFPDLTLAYDGRCREKGQQLISNSQQQSNYEDPAKKSSIEENPIEYNGLTTKSPTSKIMPSSTSSYHVIHFAQNDDNNPKRNRDGNSIISISKDANKLISNGGRRQEFSPDKDQCSADDCVCDYVLSPICGSNGVTYGNICILKCVQECSKGLVYHHAGFCGKIFFPLDQIPFFRIFKPVVGEKIEIQRI